MLGSGCVREIKTLKKGSRLTCENAILKIYLPPVGLESACVMHWLVASEDNKPLMVNHQAISEKKKKKNPNELENTMNF